MTDPRLIKGCGRFVPIDSSGPGNEAFVAGASPVEAKVAGSGLRLLLHEQDRDRAYRRRAG